MPSTFCLAKVDSASANGTTFERYDEGTITTDEKGVATFEGGARVAYFRDLTATPTRLLKRRAPERSGTPILSLRDRLFR